MTLGTKINNLYSSFSFEKKKIIVSTCDEGNFQIMLKLTVLVAQM